MNRVDPGQARGILHRPGVQGRMQHERVAPGPELAPFVAHFWTVAWSLERPFVAETLPHPSVHLTVEAERAEVGGVNTGRFSRELSGEGRVFGIKFRPAAFQPWLGQPLHRLTNRVVPVREVFGPAAEAWAQQVRAEGDFARCLALASAFLRERRPALDPRVAQVRDLIERLERDRELVRVEQVAELAGVARRQLERRFRTYAGVTPKWVIQRYRLHEASEQLAEAPDTDLADLAARLGYFDQAHFIRDFQKVIGRSPGAFRQERAGPGPSARVRGRVRPAP